MFPLRPFSLVVLSLNKKAFVGWVEGRKKYLSEQPIAPKPNIFDDPAQDVGLSLGLKRLSLIFYIAQPNLQNRITRSLSQKTLMKFEKQNR
jgi:hypothetical protein